MTGLVQRHGEEKGHVEQHGIDQLFHVQDELPASLAGVRVLLANPRGFCAGVDRAIEIVEISLERYGAPIYVRHEIVHNRHVVEELRAKGAVFIDDLADVPRGARLIYSAHGVSPAVGEGAVTAMFAGCAIGLIGSILGTVPMLLTRDRSMPSAMPAITGSMFVRLVSVVVLGFALALTGRFDVNALLLWLVIAHGGLLVADSSLTLKLLHLPENR